MYLSTCTVPIRGWIKIFNQALTIALIYGPHLIKDVAKVLLDLAKQVILIHLGIKCCTSEL